MSLVCFLFSCVVFGRIYREEAMELKLTGNALNRPKNHTGDKKTHKRNKVGNFY